MKGFYLASAKIKHEAEVNIEKATLQVSTIMCTYIQYCDIKRQYTNALIIQSYAIVLFMLVNLNL